MGITTKSGDAGWTELLFGHRVRKDDVRLRAVGTLDELNSFLGLAKSKIRKKTTKKLIHACQCDLIVVSSELAVAPRDRFRLDLRADDDMIARMEDEVRKLERKVGPTECCFLIPGGSETSALLDVCRAITRRAEREALAIRRRMTVPKPVLIYLNRLSDLLYLLARIEEKTRSRFIPAAERRKKPRKGK